MFFLFHFYRYLNRNKNWDIINCIFSARILQSVFRILRTNNWRSRWISSEAAGRTGRRITSRWHSSNNEWSYSWRRSVLHKQANMWVVGKIRSHKQDVYTLSSKHCWTLLSASVAIALWRYINVNIIININRKSWKCSMKIKTFIYFSLVYNGF